MAAAELCADHVLMGEWQKAYTSALKVLAGVEINLAYIKFTHWSLTEVLLQAGDERRAAEEIERFAGEVGTNRRLRISYLRSLAAMAAWRHAPTQAIGYLEEAMTLAEAIGLPGEVWPMQAKLGELYQKMGQENLAQQAYVRASELSTGSSLFSKRSAEF